jgi:DNA-binding transcriptional MerR regulator
MKQEHKCETKEQERIYKIGLFSKMNHVTIKTLRHYDNLDLLRPSHVDEVNGYRYYTSKQIPILHEILALREAGFSLEEIKEVQNGTSKKQLLERKRTEILRRIAEETLKLSKVESYLTSKGLDCHYHIVTKELPEVIVASMRTIMPSYDDLFSIIPPMGAEMERLGCICAEPEYCFNIYHDGEYKEYDVDVEICEAVTQMKEDSDMLHFKVVPKVELAACVLHKGAYSEFSKAYSAVLRFVEENGYEIIDNPRESYIDGVWNKDTEDEWLTEIQFPIRKFIN